MNTSQILISTVKGLSTKKERHRGVVWFYLANNYRNYRVLSKNLGTVKLLDGKIHMISAKTYQDYIDYSHRTNLLNDKLIYWSTILASRNTVSFPAFRYMAYLIFAKEQIEHQTNGQKTGFIVEDPLLGELLEMFCQENGYPCKLKLTWLETLSPLLLRFKLALRAVFFLVKHLSLHVYAKTLPRKELLKGKGNYYLLRSWITKGSFDSEGKYRDRNFGSLEKHLEEKGFSTCIVPLYFNMRESPFKTLSRVAKSPENILIQEHYLRWTDYPIILFKCLALLSVKIPREKFHGFDIGRATRVLHLRTCLMPGELNYNIILQLAQRLKRKRIKDIQCLAYPMENNSPEKILIKSFRKYFPNTTIIGVQHAVWYEQQYGMKLSAPELAYHPLPDRIVCTGEAYVDILGDCNFPKRLLHLGPNLRFRINQNPIGHQKNRRVMIVLTMDDSEMLELIIRCREVLARFTELPSVWIKAHPVTSKTALNKILAEVNFPPYTLVNGTVQDLSSKCNAVIMAPSSVSNLEVIAMGVPLIRLSMQNYFNLEPIWNESADYPSCSTALELESALVEAFRVRTPQDRQLMTAAKNITNAYFNPIDDPAGISRIGVYTEDLPRLEH